jgi:hypothetical protein
MALKFNPTTGELDVVLDKASEIKNTPSGNLAATTVQAALNELQGDINTINTDIADDVEGPASSTDNAIARFDGETGKLLQNSSVTISDTNEVAGASQINVDNLRLDGNTLSSTDTNGNIILDANGSGVVVTDDIQSSGSSGINLKNSGGTTVISVGSAGTTNVSINGTTQLNANSLLLTGSIASTGSRVTKGWFTDLEVTNAIAGSITGNAATVTTNANLTGDVTSTGNATAIAAGVIVNADVNASAAIDYSKLATLTAGNIVLGNASNVATSTAVTGDVTISNSGVTAIGSGVIVNADVNASAAIAVTKLAATTASRALVSDASGFLTAATTTSTEIGYVNGVTSAIQTQINGKMTNPMTTGGDVIYGGASGTPTRLANGTSGQVLTSAGGTSAPTWATPSVVLISTQTASSSATIDFTSISNSTYSSYELVIDNLVPATNAVFPILRFSVGGTFQTTDYSWQNYRNIGSGSGINGGEFATGATGIVIGSTSDTFANTGSYKGGFFSIKISNCSQTNTVKRVAYTGNYFGSGTLSVTGGGGFAPASSAVDGFRILFSSGNITTGTFKLYGYV